VERRNLAGWTGVSLQVSSRQAHSSFARVHGEREFREPPNARFSWSNANQASAWISVTAGNRQGQAGPSRAFPLTCLRANGFYQAKIGFRKRWISPSQQIDLQLLGRGPAKARQVSTTPCGQRRFPGRPVDEIIKAARLASIFSFFGDWAPATDKPCFRTVPSTGIRKVVSEERFSDGKKFPSDSE